MVKGRVDFNQIITFLGFEASVTLRGETHTINSTDSSLTVTNRLLSVQVVGN